MLHARDAQTSMFRLFDTARSVVIRLMGLAYDYHPRNWLRYPSDPRENYVKFEHTPSTQFVSVHYDPDHQAVWLEARICTIISEKFNVDYEALTMTVRDETASHVIRLDQSSRKIDDHLGFISTHRNQINPHTFELIVDQICREVRANTSGSRPPF
jgi:hypothetical protein